MKKCCDGIPKPAKNLARPIARAEKEAKHDPSLPGGHPAQGKHDVLRPGIAHDTIQPGPTRAFVGQSDFESARFYA